MTQPSHGVLFLCTGNSARSILAEAILGRLDPDRFRSYSAGSDPKGEIHPLALELLAERGYDTTGLRSKSWLEFARPGAPALDFIFTVCDNAAGEACPVWPGHPMTAHFGVEDPAAFAGAEAEHRRLFRHVYDQLERRIRCFVTLPLEDPDQSNLKRRLDEIAAAADSIREEG